MHEHAAVMSATAPVAMRQALAPGVWPRIRPHIERLTDHLHAAVLAGGSRYRVEFEELHPEWGHAAQGLAVRRVDLGRVAFALWRVPGRFGSGRQWVHLEAEILLLPPSAHNSVHALGSLLRTVVVPEPAWAGAWRRRPRLIPALRI